MKLSFVNFDIFSVYWIDNLKIFKFIEIWFKVMLKYFLEFVIVIKGRKYFKIYDIKSGKIKVIVKCFLEGNCRLKGLKVFRFKC